MPQLLPPYPKPPASSSLFLPLTIHPSRVSLPLSALWACRPYGNTAHILPSEIEVVGQRAEMLHQWPRQPASMPADTSMIADGLKTHQSQLPDASYPARPGLLLLPPPPSVLKIQRRQIHQLKMRRGKAIRICGGQQRLGWQVKGYRRDRGISRFGGMMEKQPLKGWAERRADDVGPDMTATKLQLSRIGCHERICCSKWFLSFQFAKLTKDRFTNDFLSLSKSYSCER